MLLQLVFDLYRHINRDGEGKSHVAAGLAVDLRVDADDLAVHVKQGPARVARVDGDIGLNEGHIVFIRQVARFCTDDAGGDGVLQAERRSDCRDPFAGPCPVRVAYAYDRQVGCVNLDQRNIGAAIHAQHLGLELAFVGEFYRDLGCIGHDVGIGQDGAVRADDKTRTLALRRLCPLLRHRNTKTAEKFKRRIVGVDGGLALERNHADVDHGRTFALNQGAEVGQAA